MPHAAVASLFRYPVKGLSPEPVEDVRLTAGAYFPGDRLFAIENGPSGFDVDDPQHLPKTKFLMLMRDERLAQLRTRFDAERNRLAIALAGAEVCEADLGEDTGRRSVETFFARFCAGDLHGPPKMLRSAPGHRFTDSRQGFVSLISLGSVHAIEDAVGRPVDPLRFRANIAVDGLEPWIENTWLGRRLQVGEALLEVIALTDRCAATSVDPQTAQRDMNIVKTLMKVFGHNICGVYAKVVTDGIVRPGDAVSVVAPTAKCSGV